MDTTSTAPRAQVEECLARADDLESKGQPEEAVALLTEQNRHVRSGEIEARLVALRHRAFAYVDKRGPSDPPPPVVAEPPPPGAIPELAAHELNPATLRDGLARFGFVMVRGLITPTRAAELAAGVDRALAAFDAAQEANEQQILPWYSHFTPDAGEYRVGGRRNWVRKSGAMWTVDSPRMLFDIVELFEETGIAELVAEHFRERPSLSANKCTLRRVPVDTNTDWHQDGAFLGADVRTVNLWLGLSPCGVDAPGLDILPQRVDRVLETGTEGAWFDWSVSSKIVDELARSTPVLRPEFAAGDALLFDQLFVHRTAVAPGMKRERYASENWFFAPSTYPDGQIPLVY